MRGTTRPGQDHGDKMVRMSSRRALLQLRRTIDSVSTGIECAMRQMEPIIVRGLYDKVARGPDYVLARATYPGYLANFKEVARMSAGLDSLEKRS